MTKAQRVLAERVRGSTQRRVARDLGVNHSQISRYLSGQVPSSDIQKIINPELGLINDWIEINRS